VSNAQRFVALFNDIHSYLKNPTGSSGYGNCNALVGILSKSNGAIKLLNGCNCDLYLI
jgi:hypothetical protein